jgi:hypothetical protein
MSYHVLEGCISKDKLEALSWYKLAIIAIVQSSVAVDVRPKCCLRRLDLRVEFRC